MSQKKNRARVVIEENCGDEAMLPVTAAMTAADGGLNVLLNRWMWKRDRAVARREFIALIATIARVEHAHCECRTPRCGHLDLRHAEGACSFPGCTCEGWL